MKMKIILVLAVAAMAGAVIARPGPGCFGGPRGGFHHGGFGGPRVGFHHGGPRYHHHYHHSGWGWGLGAAGLALGTAAVVRDIVAPRPIVYSSYATPVYSTYPGTYVAPAVYPAPVACAPVVTYGVRYW